MIISAIITVPTTYIYNCKMNQILRQLLSLCKNNLKNCHNNNSLSLLINVKCCCLTRFLTSVFYMSTYSQLIIKPFAYSLKYSTLKNSVVDPKYFFRIRIWIRLFRKFWILILLWIRIRPNFSLRRKKHNFKTKMNQKF